MENKYKKALKDVLINLRCIDAIDNVEVESYVNDSIQIIEDALEEAAQEVPVQEQLSKEITEKLNANLPLYLKKLDVKEGSITHDVVAIIVGIFLQVLREL